MQNWRSFMWFIAIKLIAKMVISKGRHGDLPLQNLYLKDFKDNFLEFVEKFRFNGQVATCPYNIINNYCKLVQFDVGAVREPPETTGFD